MADVYLLLHLPEHFREFNELRFEVQLVDQFGQSLGSAVFGDEEEPIQLNGQPVPFAVMNAAKALPVGASRYVGADGNDSCPTAFVDPVQLNDPQSPDRFFVFHLADDRPEKGATAKYEIQIVNEHGQALFWGFVGDDEMHLRISDYEISLAVLEAARRQPIGKGEFVDKNGQPVHPSNAKE